MVDIRRGRVPPGDSASISRRTLWGSLPKEPCRLLRHPVPSARRYCMDARDTARAGAPPRLQVKRVPDAQDRALRDTERARQPAAAPALGPGRLLV
jgi:hypothetical protein